MVGVPSWYLTLTLMARVPSWYLTLTLMARVPSWCRLPVLLLVQCMDVFDGEVRRLHHVRRRARGQHVLLVVQQLHVRPRHVQGMCAGLGVGVGRGS